MIMHGPQFESDEFAMFLKQNGVNHVYNIFMWCPRVCVLPNCHYNLAIEL